MQSTCTKIQLWFYFCLIICYFFLVITKVNRKFMMKNPWNFLIRVQKIKVKMALRKKMKSNK